MKHVVSPRLLWWELGALLAVLGFLWGWSAPLANEPFGLDQRFSSVDIQEISQRSLFTQAWLATHVSLVLAVLAAAGYLCLGLARVSLPAGAVLSLWAAIWLGVCGLAWAVSFENGGTPFMADWRYGFAPSGLALLFTPVAARLTHRLWLRPQRPVHALAYPGWVLFTGVGALIWLDYAAQGRPMWKWLGADHVFTLVAAYAALTLAVCVGPVFFGVLARHWARWDRSALSNARLQDAGRPWRRWLFVSVPWLVCAVLIGIIAWNTNRRFPSKGAEAIRWVVCMMGAWLIYRWASLPQHARRIALWVAVVALLCLVGMLRIHEFGQLMVLSWGASLMCGAVFTWILTTTRIVRWPVLAGVGLSCLLMVAGQALLRSPLVPYLYDKFPQHVPAHIVHRVMALQTEFEGHYSYLSELRWFIHSTPLQGHGLGHTPWLGTVLQFGGVPAKASAGVPKETHADYVLGALIGVMGWPAALALTAALAPWCLSLLRPRAMRLGSLDSSGLTQAFGLCFIVVTLAQLMVTCLGTVGWLPLTGVNFPLVGCGGASLLSCAVGMGVLMHQPRSSNPSSIQE